MSLASYHCSTPGSIYPSSLYYFGAALALPPLWPRNVRVGENSPSLCPTISSVMKTLMNCRPLCTRKVCPMNSGTTVQSRAQVLSGSLRAPMRSTLASNRSLTNGPFFLERLILLHLAETEYSRKFLDIDQRGGVISWRSAGRGDGGE